MLVKDFEAQRFRDIRNSLAHWNTSKIQIGLKFYSRRENENSKEYLYKDYRIEEIFAIWSMSKGISAAVMAAIFDEDIRRSH